MGYYDIVYEFVLCTFKLLDRVINFSWLGCSYEFNVLYLQREKYIVGYIFVPKCPSVLFFYNFENSNIVELPTDCICCRNTQNAGGNASPVFR